LDSFPTLVTASWVPIGLIAWAVGPPWLLLLFYSRRMRAAPQGWGLFVLFCLGGVAGMLALGLEWLITLGGEQLPGGRAFNRELMGHILRQVLVIGPVEEACKLSAVGVPIGILLKRYHRVPAQPSTVMLATIAVAMGFGAQESLIYLLNGRGTLTDALLRAPLQALFSAPWGLALGVALGRLNWELASGSRRVVKGWIAGAFCHAALNSLVYASLRQRWLSFLVFPWVLWLGWQFEGMVARSQGDLPPRLITATQLGPQLWQRGVVLGMVFLGGNALLGLYGIANGLERHRIDLRSGQIGTDVLLYVGMAALALLFKRWLQRQV
jgi:RsiW-degrading membrane proteinase PrsW (M82 family)